MKNVARKVREFLSDESGQGTMEYILIIGLIVIALMVTMYAFRNQLRGFIGKVNQWISKSSGEVGK